MVAQLLLELPWHVSVSNTDYKWSVFETSHNIAMLKHAPSISTLNHSNDTISSPVTINAKSCEKNL